MLLKNILLVELLQSFQLIISAVLIDLYDGSHHVKFQFYWHSKMGNNAGTDFNNSFTVEFSDELQKKVVRSILPRLKSVAALPLRNLNI